MIWLCLKGVVMRTVVFALLAMLAVSARAEPFDINYVACVTYAKTDQDRVACERIKKENPDNKKISAFDFNTMKEGQSADKGPANEPSFRVVEQSPPAVLDYDPSLRDAYIAPPQQAEAQPTNQTQLSESKQVKDWVIVVLLAFLGAVVMSFGSERFKAVSLSVASSRATTNLLLASIVLTLIVMAQRAEDRKAELSRKVSRVQVTGGSLDAKVSGEVHCIR